MFVWLAAAALSSGIAVLSAPHAKAEPEPLVKEKPPQLSEADFARINANHDGVITRDEWKLAGLDPAFFTKVDVNFDGKVTLQECLLWAKTVYLPKNSQ